MGDDLLAAQQGDVLDQDPDHALALTLGNGRISPQPWEVGGQREDLLPMSVLEDSVVGLPPALVFLLRVLKCTQLVVPVRLELLRHQPVVGIDTQVAALGELGLVTSPFHLLLAESVGLAGASSELVVDCERHLQRERRHRLDEELADPVASRQILRLERFVASPKTSG
jgi:hypothetical protein